MRIDAHHHVWNPETRSYPWMPADPRINKPLIIEDLRPHLIAHDIDATVLVQTVSDVDETREFLGLARDNAEIAGVVGWVDLTSPSVAETIAAVRGRPGGEFLVGIRHQIHDETDPEWALRADVQRGLQAVADADLVFDLLVKELQLPAAIAVAKQFPKLRFVIDHIAKPRIASGELEPWRTLMRQFAPLANVSCKLSGMITEANADSWTPVDLVPFVREVCEVFGPDRLMFGSDWPVCLLAGSYADVVRALDDVLTQLGCNEPRIWGENARRIYRIP